MGGVPGSIFEGILGGLACAGRRSGPEDALFGLNRRARRGRSGTCDGLRAVFGVSAAALGTQHRRDGRKRIRGNGFFFRRIIRFGHGNSATALFAPQGSAAIAARDHIARIAPGAVNVDRHRLLHKRGRNDFVSEAYANSRMAFFIRLEAICKGNYTGARIGR